MKTIKNIALSLLAGSMLLTSCGSDFLDKVPEGSYNIDNYYESDAALEAATAPLYNRAWFNYNSDMALATGSMRANDCFSGAWMTSYVYFQVTALDDYMVNGWTGLYSVVIMANSVIDAAKNKAKNVSESIVDRTIAEARIMRGAAYFYMLRTWGPVILFEDNEGTSRIPKKPLNPEKDVLEFVIRDFTYAAEHLPEKSYATGRATKWAAEALLAKAYLARSGWDKSTRDESDLQLAQQYALDVIENSGLNLMDDYADLFKYKHNNNEESLLAMQWVPLGSWTEQNTMISTLTYMGDDRITGTGTSAYGVWGAPQATVDMLEQFEPNDKRLDACFFTNGTHYDYINMVNGGLDYDKETAYIKKGVLGQNSDDNDNKINTMNSPLNTYIIRLADVYLTYAEACLGNSESLSSGKGLLYYNKIRERAGLADVSSFTFDDLIRERRCEFAGEWCNWYDMVTWYKWKPQKMLRYFRNQDRGTVCSNVKKSEDGTHVIIDQTKIERPSIEIEVSDDNIFLPYPEVDVIQNPYLKEDPQPYEFSEE